MSLAESYTREIRKQLRRFATWEPGVPMRLGDFGELRGSQFVRLGDIGQMAIAFETREDGAADHVSYTSEGAVELAFGAGGAADVALLADAKATLRVDFGARYAILFTAADVAYRSMADHLALEKAILERFEESAWDARHVIVTELVHSGSTTVIVSSGSNASITLEAEGGAKQIDLADASIRARASAERNIGYKAVTATGMTPLLGLSRIRPRGLFWWRHTELRKQLGYAPADDSESGELRPSFQRELDDHLDTLRAEARRRGALVDAFEWADLQPRERP